MVLQVKSLEFYEGTALEMFKSRMSDKGLRAGENNGIVGLYLELSGFPPENATLAGPTKKPPVPSYIVT